MANRYFFGHIGAFQNINNPMPNFLTGMIRCEPWPDLSAINAGQYVFGTGIEYVYNYIVWILKSTDTRFTPIQIMKVQRCVDKAVDRAHLNSTTPAVSKFAELHAEAIAMLQRMVVQTGSARLLRTMDIVMRTMEIGGMTETEAQQALQDVHNSADGSLTTGRMQFAL
ncbi:hypothetical protein HBI81_139900 [Parastagonospora nodorum]|nr:hypothetical protein HBH51_095780 [Parastagonospora nodorum]KAH4064697.1 hypothetical protein HBH50_174380 [Parastagonospora nodorum]KAH4083879.1 hypothetical protein HBH48_171980 [Parastagonospora nodorum]KAH4118894.1 hypothetical protein HBH47_133690 [Parastagonospora nodorum]KAH4186404.1 hypothetical protein HBH42_165610 [Parastagonospora nodorum]